MELIEQREWNLLVAARKVILARPEEIEQAMAELRAVERTYRGIKRVGYTLEVVPKVYKDNGWLEQMYELFRGK